MLKKVLLTIISKFYLLGIKIRHKLFDLELLRSVSFDIPVICIGNITVGGTGKTPMCELLIEHYSQSGDVALISRGYGRKTKGYREVNIDDKYLDVGDEPLQMKCKYPNSVVVVCEDRVVGIKRIIKEHPEVKIILMDDGFQHRYVEAKVNIIMVDATRPIDNDQMLPLGTLRDTPDALHRADIFMVTKCPNGINPLERRLITHSLCTMSYQKIFFTQVANLEPHPIYPDEAPRFNGEMEVIAMAGIGNPKPFVETIEQRYNMVDTIIYNDHHAYTKRDIKHITTQLEKHPKAVVIMTEKDNVKFLMNPNIPETMRSRIYYTPIRMRFLTGSSSELLKTIDRNVK